MPEAALAERPTTVIEKKALKPTAFGGADFAYAIFSATLPVGTSYEDTLVPEFWVHVAHILAQTPVTGEPDRAGAIIELRTIDHAFYAKLYVRAVNKGGLIVSPLGEPIYFGPKQVKAGGFDVRWNVGRRGYDIVRKPDGTIVAENLKTKEEAQAWIDATMKAH
jgi:hypothetical protein